MSHVHHAKATEPQGTPGGTSGVPCPTPAEPQGTPRRTSESCRSPKGRQSDISTAPQGMPGPRSNPLAAHVNPCLAHKRNEIPRNARRYIASLGSVHWPKPVTEKNWTPRDARAYRKIPWQCTLCQAWHAKTTEPQGTPGRTSNPLAVHIVPRLPRKSGGAPRDARAYIRPLGNLHCATPITQKRQCQPQATPGHTSNPLAVHLVPRMPRKSGGAPRNARAYIRPLGSIRCPTPVTQKRRSPKEHQGKCLTP